MRGIAEVFRGNGDIGFGGTAIEEHHGTTAVFQLFGPHFGVAVFTIVIEPGKTTAAAERLRSWAPPEPSRDTKLVWYGDPEIVTAELTRPQSSLLEMCPPQARTAVDPLAVKLIAMLVELSPE